MNFRFIYPYKKRGKAIADIGKKGSFSYLMCECIPHEKKSLLSTTPCLYLNSISDKLMIVTVLIRYKSWQSQFLFGSFNFYCFTIFFLFYVPCLLLLFGFSLSSFLLLFISHYAHKLCEIYLLSALKTHGER